MEEDKTAEEMVSLFNEVKVQGDPAKTVQDGDDSFVCCISSHGGWDPTLNTDVVFGSTGVAIQEGRHKVPKGAIDVKKRAYESFSPGRNRCPILEGKPKIFLIQACRGIEHETIEYDDISQHTIAVKPRHLPRETDFLFAYATAPGKVAHRRVGGAQDQLGSFFITSLCHNLTNYAKQLPLAPLLDLVSQELNTESNTLIKTSTITTRESPNFMSSLRGPVFFSNTARKRYKRKVLSGLI